MLTEIIEGARAFVATEGVISHIHLYPYLFINLIKLGLRSFFPLSLRSHLFMLLNHRPGIKLTTIHRPKWVIYNFNIVLNWSLTVDFLDLFIDSVELQPSNQICGIDRSSPYLVLTFSCFIIFSWYIFWLDVESHNLSWFLNFGLYLCVIQPISDLQSWFSRGVPISFFLLSVNLLQFFSNIYIFDLRNLILLLLLWILPWWFIQGLFWRDRLRRIHDFVLLWI